MTNIIAVYKGETMFVVTDILSGVTSQGNSFEEAKSNLKEALELYYEDIPVNEWPKADVLIATLEVTPNVI